MNNNFIARAEILKFIVSIGVILILGIGGIIIFGKDSVIVGGGGCLLVTITTYYMISYFKLRWKKKGLTEEINELFRNSKLLYFIIMLGSLAAIFKGCEAYLS